MNAPPLKTAALADRLPGGGEADGWIADRQARVSLDPAARAGWIAADDLKALRGASVLIRTSTQLTAALALIALDGSVRRLILAPPDLDPAHLPTVLADGEVTAIITDEAMGGASADSIPVLTIHPFRNDEAVGPQPPRPHATEWVMFTSGTSGPPKMVAHTLGGLTDAIAPQVPGDAAPPPVWATFYDIRRFGGLQILLRALIGGRPMVLSEPSESTPDFLARMGASGVTHVSGTPSHWRRVLMTPRVADFAPIYVRLSGEIADQPVLDQLKAAFPDAAIGHAYASTEAGVGFDINDGLAGFPLEMIGATGTPVEMRLKDGALHIRSRRTAARYLGAGAQELADAEGFVDTGDGVERRGDRLHFTGRLSGVISVGGLKLSPEEVEAVINATPGVSLSRVAGRKSPITGALVVAEVVADAPVLDTETLREAILARCRAELAPHKVPVRIGFVDHLPVTPGGKLERRHA